MKNKLKVLLAALIMLVPLLAGLGAPLSADAAGNININLHKKRYDSTPAVIQNTGEIMTEFNGVAGFGGVEFKIYNVTDSFYTLLETTNPDTGKKYTMPEASEEVKVNYASGTLADTKTTATTGNVGDLTFSALPDKTNGKNSVFVIVETPMAGVTTADNMVVALPLEDSTGAALTDIHLYPKNVVQTAGVKVEKIANVKDDANKTIPLAGVEFVIHKDGVYNGTGTMYLKDFDGADTPVWTNVAADAHKFVTDVNGRFEEDRLLYGTYYLTEVKSKDGYTINNNAINQQFTLDALNTSKEFTGDDAIQNDDIQVEKTNTGGTVNVGDKIDYTVKTTIPGGILDQVDTNGDGVADTPRYANFIIKDTHGTHLKLDQTTLTLSDGTTTFTTADYALDTTVAGEFKVTFNTAGISKMKPNATLTMSYKMELLETAAPGADIDNTATITTDHDENTGSGSEIYTGGHKFKKVDSSNGDAPLAGAKFVVRDADNDSAKYLNIGTDGEVTWVAALTGATTFTSGTDGSITVKGLKDGKYYLEETETANDKYVLLSSRVEFEVTKTSFDTTPLGVPNKQKGSLPSTGGTGIYLMMAAGVLVMAVVGLGYVRSQRKEA